MLNYQGRVIEEKRSLDEKIVKLEKFQLSNEYVKVDWVERGRLSDQLLHMKAYSKVLGERIMNFRG